MTAPSNTRRTRKSADTTDATAPTATPAPVQAAPDATDQATAPIVADQSTSADTTPAYTIPEVLGDNFDQDSYVASVGEAYRSADKSTKAAIRSAWNKFQSDALNDLDMAKLALVRDVNAVLVTSRPVVEVDPTDAYATRIKALRLAADDLMGKFVEEFGASGRFGADADATRSHLSAALDADRSADEWKVIGDMASKLATVPTGRRTGPQRSVEAHIRSALDAAPKGTILTCAQIHNHRSEAYGADESPSVGAIGAAYGREMDGIESVHNDDKVKGFRLA